jgi:hypothetical protein
MCLGSWSRSGRLKLEDLLAIARYEDLEGDEEYNEVIPVRLPVGTPGYPGVLNTRLDIGVPVPVRPRVRVSTGTGRVRKKYPSGTPAKRYSFLHTTESTTKQMITHADGTRMVAHDQRTASFKRVSIYDKRFHESNSWYASQASDPSSWRQFTGHCEADNRELTVLPLPPMHAHIRHPLNLTARTTPPKLGRHPGRVPPTYRAFDPGAQ